MLLSRGAFGSMLLFRWALWVTCVYSVVKFCIWISAIDSGRAAGCHATIRCRSVASRASTRSATAITSPFGRDGYRWHPGLDIGILQSLDVRAAAGGVVVLAGFIPGYDGYGAPNTPVRMAAQLHQAAMGGLDGG